MTLVTLILSSGLLALLLIPIWLNYQRKQIDYLDPIFFVILSVSLGVIVRGVYLTTVDPRIFTGFILGLEFTDLIVGYFFVYFALIFFVLGYSCNIKRGFYLGRLLSNRDWSNSKVKLVCFVMIAISILFWAKFISTINLGDFVLSAISRKRSALDENGMKIATGYLRWGVSLATLAYYIFLINLCKKTNIGKFEVVVGLLLFIAAIAFPVFTSVRIEVISIIFNSLIIVHFGRSKLNNTFQAKYIVILFVSFTAIVVTSATMSNFRKGSIDDKEISDIISAKSILRSIVGNQNFYGIGKSTIAVVKVDEYLYGKSIASIFTAPIPRGLWKNKPEVGMSYYFGSKYYGIDYTGNQGGGMPPGISIELFINFGYIGLAIGMWIYGFLLRVYYISISTYLYKRDASAILLHVSLLIPLTLYMTGNDIAQATIAMMTLFLPSVLLIKYLEA